MNWHSALKSLPVLIGMVVVGVICALNAPRMVSRVGTEEEIDERILKMRGAGMVMAVAAAAMLVLRQLGWLD